tara:strand:+ start:7587 stop:8366 length:780 start_codon:yes stop_codon:yes gene_type:complete
MDIHRPPLSATAEKKHKLRTFDWMEWCDTAIPLLELNMVNNYLARDPVYLNELVRHLLHATPSDIHIRISRTHSEELVYLVYSCFFEHRYQAMYFCEYFYRYAGRNTLGIPRHAAMPLKRFDDASVTVSDDIFHALIDDVLMGNEYLYPFIDTYLRSLAYGETMATSASVFIKNAHMEENALAGYEINASKTIVDTCRKFVPGMQRQGVKVHYTADYRDGVGGYVLSMNIRPSLYCNNHNLTSGHCVEGHISNKVPTAT